MENEEEKKTENTGNNIKLYNKTKLGYYKSYQKQTQEIKIWWQKV